MNHQSSKKRISVKTPKELEIMKQKNGETDAEQLIQVQKSLKMLNEEELRLFQRPPVDFIYQQLNQRNNGTNNRLVTTQATPITGKP